jgi:hypothetical protein
MTVILFAIRGDFSMLSFSVIILSSLVIDIDHLFYDLPEKRDSLREIMSYWWDMADKYKGRFYLFHTVDALLVTFFLGMYIHPFFMYVFTGFFFHIIQDSITNTQAIRSLKWLKNYSIITYIIAKKGE